MPPIAAELEERLDQVVVARVQIEARRDDVTRLVKVVVRLLHRAHRLDLGEPGDRLRLDVDDHAAPGCCRRRSACRSPRDRLEVRDDPALGRLVVVRRDDEEARRRRARAPARSGGPSARSSRCPCRRRRWRRSRPPRSRRGRGRAARRRSGSGSRRSSRDDDPVGAVLDEVPREPLERIEVDRAVLAKRGDDRSQNVAEHHGIVRGRSAKPTVDTARAGTSRRKTRRTIPPLAGTPLSD